MPAAILSFLLLIIIFVILVLRGIRSNRHRAAKVIALTLAFLLICGVAAWNLIPAYFRNLELQDHLDDIARRQSYTQASDDEIRGVVLQQAENLGLPISDRQISVTRDAKGVSIEVHYTVRALGIALRFDTLSLNKRI